MTTAWILLITIAGSTSLNGPLIVPNLVSYEECVRVSKEVVTSIKDVRGSVDVGSKCIEVRTAK